MSFPASNIYNTSFFPTHAHQISHFTGLSLTLKQGALNYYNISLLQKKTLHLLHQSLQITQTSSRATSPFSFRVFALLYQSHSGAYFFYAFLY